MSSTFITASEGPGGPPQDAGQLSKLRWAVKNPPSDPQISFAGKTVLVTGANTGLGFEAAVKYSALGAEKLILGVRSIEKGEVAKKQILERTGRKNETIDIVTVDLSDFGSVQAFVPALEAKVEHLDVALLCAGLGNPTYVKASTGWEMAIQVNVLSTALIAILLLPLLRQTAAAGRQVHMTFVESVGHEAVQKEWFSEAGSLLEASNKEEGWDATKSYSMVKLLGMSVMDAVARATASAPASGIIVNAVCPGLCKTDLGRNFNLAAKVFMVPFQAIFARTAEQGSRSLVSATAIGPESHGKFWNHDILYP
ncbi:short-chain dehydrogenase reductase sdr [Trichoderma arundinaceum]|uniref:Short-chain dehydrogenase reductase sdr n=1 Tax=Trichoderma arundinaceum TaxID=490622 RepID=A0A395NWY6_TRIAR|nr:short-chain dehydrogenase reductase sdr [Trichoderma arundinaceum]